MTLLDHITLSEWAEKEHRVNIAPRGYKECREREVKAFTTSLLRKEQENMRAGR